MGFANSKEPDPEVARAIAEGGCILRCVVGSTVHGLSNPGTDDRDEMGVCVEPPEYVVGLRPFEHWASRTQPEGRPSGPGDLDVVVYGLRKFCRLALKGSPTVLLLLFVDGEHVVERSPIGEELQALAPAFVSRRTAAAFLGYVDAQRRGLLGDRHATRTRELGGPEGYDTKYAMHAARIAIQGCQLLRTGRIPLPVPEPDRSMLRSIRRGEPALGEVIEQIDRAADALRRLADDASMPAGPDVARVDSFLVSAYRQHWRDRIGSKRGGG
jgi:uncharacterized protein